MISGPENFPPSNFDRGDEENEKSPYIEHLEEAMKERSLDNSRGYMKGLDKAYVAMSKKIALEGLSEKAALGEVNDSASEYNDGIMATIENEAEEWVDNLPAEKKEYLYNTTVADEIASRRGKVPSLVRKALTKLSDEQDLRDRIEEIDNGLAVWYKLKRAGFYEEACSARFRAFKIVNNPDEVKRLSKNLKLEEAQLLPALYHMAGLEDKTPSRADKGVIKRVVDYLRAGK